MGETMKSTAVLTNPVVICTGTAIEAETGTAIWLGWGNIKDDTSSVGDRPFPDGTQIRTSPIEDIVTEDGKQYLVTRNSVYEISGEINYQGPVFIKKAGN